MPQRLMVFAAGLLLGGITGHAASAQQVSITETPPAAAQRAVTAGDKAAARRHIARGDDLAAHGSDWDQAAAEYRLALERDPTSAEAHYDLAGSLHDGGLIEACILEYQQAIHLDMPDPAGAAHNPPRTADAYRQLGLIRQDKNQLISAVANFRASLRLAPDNVSTHADLADALTDRGLFAAAVPEYQAVLRMDPSGNSTNLESVHISLGNCNDDLKNFVAAVHEYRTAVRLEPNDDVAHYDLARELQVLGRYPEALREIHESLRLKPGDAASQDELGCILYGSGEHEQGRIEWRKVLRMGNADEADAARERLAENGP